uniref:Endonuclease/exonuclease/phosphatase domain-containing protein n=1 Tax=Strigamia maritima TaxID=126957 RepID=T1JMD3_STRMM
MKITNSRDTRPNTKTFDNTATESDCSTERASQSESGEPNPDEIQRANLKAQFKRYATSGTSKKIERRLPRVLKEVGANHQGAAISGYLHKKTKKAGGATEGEALIDWCYYLQLDIANGLVEGDREEKITFIGMRGHSVVDYILTNDLDAIANLTVETRTDSDHLSI